MGEQEKGKKRKVDKRGEKGGSEEEEEGEGGRTMARGGRMRKGRAEGGVGGVGVGAES